ADRRLAITSDHQPLEMVRRIALAGRGAERKNMVERVRGVGRDPQPRRGSVFLEAVDMARAWDRHDEWAARQQPGDRQLCRRAAFGRGMSLQFLDQREVAREVVALETRHVAPRVAVA